MSGPTPHLIPERTMIDLNYTALAETPVGTDPFPHLVVPGFVPPDDLRAVLAALPPLNRRGSFPPDSVRLGAVAQDLVTAMEGPVLRSLLEALGFHERIRGSHHIFTRSDVIEIINLQPKGAKAKSYQVRQVRQLILKYNLGEEDV